MLGDVLNMMSLAISAAGFGYVLRRSATRFYGFAAIANGLAAAGHALHRDRGWASCLAGVCGVAAWMWWNSGGGDGTRRRLRSLGRAFRGVRRTAPSAGAS